MLHIYVDGSYNFKEEVAGWGFVVIESGNNGILYEDCGKTPYIALGRQIDGELYATLKALEWISKSNYKNVKIFYDYIGIEYFYTNKWKAKKPVARSYVRYVGRFKRENKDVAVEFEHVYGHTGNKWNEYADRLAGKGKHL